MTTASYFSNRSGEVTVGVSSVRKNLSTMRMSNYVPDYSETSSVGKRMLLLPDEVLRFPLDEALVIIRGQKVLKVRKFDYSRHPEAKKLVLEKTECHVPDWRMRESGMPETECGGLENEYGAESAPEMEDDSYERGIRQTAAFAEEIEEMERQEPDLVVETIHVQEEPELEDAFQKDKVEIRRMVFKREESEADSEEDSEKDSEKRGSGMKEEKIWEILSGWRIYLQMTGNGIGMSPEEIRWLLETEFMAEIGQWNTDAWERAGKALEIYRDVDDFLESTGWGRDNPEIQTEAYLTGNRICRWFKGRLFYFSWLVWDQELNV